MSTFSVLIGSCVRGAGSSVVGDSRSAGAVIQSAAPLPRWNDRFRGSPTSVSDPMPPLSFQESCRSTFEITGAARFYRAASGGLMGWASLSLCQAVIAPATRLPPTPALNIRMKSFT